MIVAKVTYTVIQNFVAQNQENIHRFLKDFEKLSQDFRYTVYQSADGKTFMHLSHYKNAEIQKQLLAVESFLSFQKQRDESGLEAQPQVEMMNLIGSSVDVF